MNDTQKNHLPPPPKPPFPKPKKRPFHACGSGSQISAWAVEWAVALVVMASTTLQKAGKLLTSMLENGLVIATVSFALKNVVLATTTSTVGWRSVNLEQRLWEAKTAWDACSSKTPTLSRGANMLGLWSSQWARLQNAYYIFSWDWSALWTVCSRPSSWLRFAQYHQTSQVRCDAWRTGGEKSESFSGWVSIEFLNSPALFSLWAAFRFCMIGRLDRLDAVIWADA